MDTARAMLEEAGLIKGTQVKNEWSARPATTSSTARFTGPLTSNWLNVALEQIASTKAVPKLPKWPKLSAGAEFWRYWLFWHSLSC